MPGEEVRNEIEEVSANLMAPLKNAWICNRTWLVNHVVRRFRYGDFVAAQRLCDVSKSASRHRSAVCGSKR